MRIKRFYISFFIIFALILFIDGCAKKSDNVPISELQAIVSKPESNYTVVINNTVIGASVSKLTYKYDAETENGVVKSCKSEMRIGNDITYGYYTNNIFYTIGKTSDGHYEGHESKNYSPESIDDFMFLKDMIADNIELFTYDERKQIYSGTVTDPEGLTAVLQLSVANGHIIYFDATMSGTKIYRLTFDFSNYGTTEVSIPRFNLKGQVYYEEGYGKVSALQWRRIFNSTPQCYEMSINGNDLETGRGINQIIRFDNTRGNYYHEDGKYSYILDNNQAYYIEKIGYRWFARTTDQDFSNPLQDLINQYFTSYEDFAYNNNIGGYERYVGDLKIEVQFMNNDIYFINLIKNRRTLTYNFSYQVKSYEIPPYEIVDEIPEFLPQQMNEELWYEICHQEFYSYEISRQHSNYTFDHYAKANEVPGDNSSLYYCLYQDYDGNTVYYTKEEDGYYRYQLTPLKYFIVKKVAFEEIPIFNDYEDYLAQITDFSKLKYDWYANRYYYQLNDRTIKMAVDHNQKHIFEIVDVIDGATVLLYFGSFNQVRQWTYTPEIVYEQPFESDAEWLAATQIGTNFTMYEFDMKNGTAVEFEFDANEDHFYMSQDSGNGVSYYKKIDNKYYLLLEVDGQIVAQDIETDLMSFANLSELQEYFVPSKYSFNETLGRYEGRFGINLLTKVYIYFENGKLEIVEIESPAEHKRYAFTKIGTTNIFPPNSVLEKTLWQNAISQIPRISTITYTNSTNPDANSITRICYYRDSIEKLFYYPAVGEDLIVEQLPSNTEASYRVLYQIKGEYYYRDADIENIDSYDIIKPYRTYLVDYYEQFDRLPNTSTYVATIDGITYTLGIKNGLLNYLQVVTEDMVETYTLTDLDLSTLPFPKYHSFEPDLETKPNYEEIDALFDNPIYYFRYYNSQKPSTEADFYRMPYYEDGILKGTLYKIRTDSRTVNFEWIYDYYVETPDEQYFIAYFNGYYEKRLVSQKLNQYQKIERFDTIFEALTILKNHPELLVYNREGDCYRLRFNNEIYILKFSDKMIEINIDPDGFSPYDITIRFTADDDFAFTLPPLNKPLTEDEFFSMTRNRPTNFKSVINYQNGDVSKQINVEYQEDIYLIKLDYAGAERYYNLITDKIYVLSEGQYLEVDDFREEVAIVLRALEVKQNIIIYYRTHYLNVRFNGIENLYHTKTPADLLSEGVVNISFQISQDHITNFAYEYGAIRIEINTSNYGEVDLIPMN